MFFLVFRFCFDFFFRGFLAPFLLGAFHGFFMRWVVFGAFFRINVTVLARDS